VSQQGGTGGTDRSVGADVADLAANPPTTGLPEVDEALARLTALDEQPVGDHPDRLASAHETLHRALESPRGSDDA
jgi:hypothetical protein